MPYMNLWGINPLTKTASSYISHVQYSDRLQWESKALSEGWTQLKWGHWTSGPLERDSDGEAQAEVPRTPAPAAREQAGKPALLPERQKVGTRAKRK